MKRIMFMILAFVLISTVAYAAEEAGKSVSVDFSLNWAQGSKDVYPTGLFNGTAGPELGVNVNLKRLGMDIGTSTGIEFQGRASISYYEWSESFFSHDSYRRIPLFVGIRGLVPFFTKYVTVYGQIGPEISFDNQKDYSFWTDTLKSDENSVGIGITPGVGIHFNIYRVYLGVAFNYHLIKDPYSTFGITLGYNF